MDCHIGYLKVLGAVLIWAVINGLIIKDAGNYVAPTVLGALMSLVGVILFLPTMFYTGRPKLDKRKKFLLLGLGLSAALNNSFFYTALTMTPVYNAALIHYFASVLAILWIVVVPVFKEKLDKASLVSVILGIIGLIIMTGSSWMEHKPWLYFALLSAVFYSLEIVFSRQVSQNEVDPKFSAFTKLGFQLLIMPVVGLMLGHSFHVPLESLPYIGFAGLLLFISFVLIFSGLKIVPVKHFSALGYLDRVGAIAIGRFYWGEVFGPAVWIGGFLILAAEIPIIFFTKKDA